MCKHKRWIFCVATNTIQMQTLKCLGLCKNHANNSNNNNDGLYFHRSRVRVIFIEDHIPIRRDRSLLLGRQTSKWSLWEVVFHENNSIITCLKLWSAVLNKLVEPFHLSTQCSTDGVQVHTQLSLMSKGWSLKWFLLVYCLKIEEITLILSFQFWKFI